MWIGLGGKVTSNVSHNDSPLGLVAPVVDSQAPPGRASPSFHMGAEHDGSALIRPLIVSSELDLGCR